MDLVLGVVSFTGIVLLLVVVILLARRITTTRSKTIPVNETTPSTKSI